MAHVPKYVTGLTVSTELKPQMLGVECYDAETKANASLGVTVNVSHPTICRFVADPKHLISGGAEFIPPNRTDVWLETKGLACVRVTMGRRVDPDQYTQGLSLDLSNPASEPFTCQHARKAETKGTRRRATLFVLTNTLWPPVLQPLPPSPCVALWLIRLGQLEALTTCDI